MSQTRCLLLYLTVYTNVAGVIINGRVYAYDYHTSPGKVRVHHQSEGGQIGVTISPNVLARADKVIK